MNSGHEGDGLGPAVGKLGRASTEFGDGLL